MIWERLLYGEPERIRAVHIKRSDLVNLMTVGRVDPMRVFGPTVEIAKMIPRIKCLSLIKFGTE